MSTSKTWLLDSTTDYNAWTHSTAANVTASFDSTTTDADGTSPNGSIKYALTTSASGGACYSEISGTWEDFGVPAGATVTKVQATVAWQLTAASRLNNAAAIGPFTLRDSSGNLLDTLASALTLTGVTTWADRTGGVVTLTSPSASSTTVRFRIGSTVQTASGAGPSVTLMVDWARLVINYSTPQSIAGTTTATVVVGKVPGKLFALTSAMSISLKRVISEFMSVASTMGMMALLALTRVRSIPGASRLWLKRSDGLRALRYSALLKSPAVQNLTQALAVTATLTSVFVKQAGKKVAATMTDTVAALKSVGKNIPATSTLTAVLTKIPGKVFAVASTMTTALKKSVSKTIAAATTATTTLIKGVNKTLAATTTLTAAIKKAVGKLVDAAATLGVLLGKGFAKVLNTVSMGLTVALSALAVGVKAYEKLMEISSAFSVSLSKIPNKLLAVGDALSARIERQTIKIVAVGAVLAVRLLKQMERSLPYSASLALTLGKVLGKSLQIVLASGLGLSKSVNKAFALAASFATSLDKSVRKLLVVTATLVATAVRRTGKALAVSLTATAAFIKARLKTLAVSPAFNTAIVQSFIAVVRGIARAVVTRITYILSAISRTAEATSTVEKVVKARGSADKES